MNEECFHEWEEVFRHPWNDSEQDENGKTVEIVRTEIEYQCIHCGLVIRKRDKKLLSEYLNEKNNSLY